jgi:hypothetical protein
LADRLTNVGDVQAGLAVVDVVKGVVTDLRNIE